MNKNWKIWMPVLSLTLAACGSNKSSTPATALDGGATNASFAMKLASGLASQPKLSAQALTSADGALNITSATVNVEKVSLKLPDGITCAAAGFVAADRVTCIEESETEDGVAHVEAKIKIQGPFVFDLIAGTSTPDIGTVKVPSGVYRKVEVKLGGLSAAGTFSGKNFQIALVFSDKIKIEPVGGIEVKENFSTQLLVQLNIMNWLSGIPLANCIASGDVTVQSGEFKIDVDHKGKGSCDRIDDLVKENIKNSFEVEKHEVEDEGLSGGR